MIVFVLKRKNQTVVFRNKKELFSTYKNLTDVFISLAIENPNEIMLWCREDNYEFIDFDYIKRIFDKSTNILQSYLPNTNDFFDNKLGYIEFSPFLKINKSVKYPTWLMSSYVGVIHASVVIKTKDIATLKYNFEYYINSIAKILMPLGLNCYSNPNLLLPGHVDKSTHVKQSMGLIFKFVAQHYKKRWVLLLCLNLLIFERKWTIISMIRGLFYKKITFDYKIPNPSFMRKHTYEDTVDVLIPTIGRKEHLLNVLYDLSDQVKLPTNVIIIEQNPDLDSNSDLEYLTSKEWNFSIQHIFTHVTGACNARNLGLQKVESKWVFFADDDIRIPIDFIEKCLTNCLTYNQKAITLACYLKGGKTQNKCIKQWVTFGSGCSFVLANSIEKVKFDKRFEFGFGEDSDYGMQLRNQGVDVMYFTDPSVLHLKAPIGGFRTKNKLQWHNDSIQPKPAPTVMLYKILHDTTEQLNGYKIVLFFNYYKNQKTKNPYSYYKKYIKQWNQSVFWATKLEKMK